MRESSKTLPSWSALPSCAKSHQQGFSLIEVLIAMVVFSVGILAVASMQITSTGGNSKARYISEATSYGVDKMEDLLNRSYTDPLLNDTNGDGLAGLDNKTVPTADGNSGSAFGDYTIFWNVAVNQPIPNTKTMHVVVTHPLLNNPVVLEFMKATSP